MLVVMAIVFSEQFLISDPNHHLLIRQAGVQYLSNNPEHFIKSNTENSWNEYINNMSMQGTWCDALIVQKSCRVSKCSNSYHRIS